MIAVRASIPEDAERIAEALQAHLPLERALEWRVPQGSSLLVADENGVLVAFTAVRQTALGIVVDDLWQVPGRTGLVGLARLGQALCAWADSTQQRIGGLVEDWNVAHARQLKKHGFAQRAVLYVREPQGVQAREKEGILHV